jgi:LDH2 family malate/lactate/ureidoglycolate dehydrogenase
MAIIASSDPSEASVAPFGGTRAVVTPDPIAAGIPTEGDPILVDISASISTNGMTARYHKEGRRLPGLGVQGVQGHASDDPAALFTDPPGTLLPMGGVEYGHKGFGLAQMIEALTQGLGGFGRVEAPPEWGAAVFVQVLDPEAFGDLAGFRRQMEALVPWRHRPARARRRRPAVDAGATRWRTVSSSIPGSSPGWATGPKSSASSHPGRWDPSRRPAGCAPRSARRRSRAPGSRQGAC